MAWQARSSGTLPILTSPQLTFETASALANVEGYISAKTPLKVERAQVGEFIFLCYLQYIHYLTSQSFRVDDRSCLFFADVV